MLESNQQGVVHRRVLVPKFKAYLSLIKPVTSVSIMLAIPFTALLYGELHGATGVAFLFANLEPVALASAVAFLTHSGTQSLNMSEDAHIDSETEHKSDRPIPSGVISRDEARSLAWATVLVGVGLAFAVNTAFGAYTIVLVALGVWYNLDPVRTKKRLWINLVWQAISRGLLLYPAAFAVFGDPLNPVAWGMGVVAFLLVLSLQNTADFSDVDMDGAYDIRTPAVYHGLRPLVGIMAVLSVLVFGTLTALIYLGVVPNFWSLGLLAVPIYWSLWKLWTGPESVSSVGDNHASWYVYYLCLASLYIVPPIQLIVFP